MKFYEIFYAFPPKKIFPLDNPGDPGYAFAKFKAQTDEAEKYTGFLFCSEPPAVEGRQRAPDGMGCRGRAERAQRL